MRNAIIATLVIAALGLLAFAGIAVSRNGMYGYIGVGHMYAAGHGYHMMGGNGQCTYGTGMYGAGSHLAYAEELGLTDEQKAKLKALENRYAEARIRGRAELEALRAQLGTLITNNADEAKISAKTGEIAGKESQLDSEIAGLAASIDKVLTDEQFDDYNRMMFGPSDSDDTGRQYGPGMHHRGGMMGPDDDYGHMDRGGY